MSIVSGQYRFPVVDQGYEGRFDLPPIERALRDVERGIADGYPLCCVLEFALDTLENRYPGARRGSVPDGAGGIYVPCTACCEAMGRETI